MNKTEKSSEIKEISDRFSRAKSVVLSEYAGLGVEDLRKLRNNVRKVNGEFKVMKNTLVQKAIETSSYKPMQPFFKGPIGVVFGYDDPIGAIKAAKEFSEKEKVFRLIGGMIEGKVLNVKDLGAVANLPSRQVMIGQLLSRMQSPLYGLVRTLNGIVNKFVYALNAIKEKKEAGC